MLQHSSLQEIITSMQSPRPATPQTLKIDAFGATEMLSDGKKVCRNTDRARPWLRPLARALARREAVALIRLNDCTGIPRLLGWDGRRLERSHLAGEVLYAADAVPRAWFGHALRLLRRMHARNIAHNDLAKEANCLLRDDGTAGFIDFQLAVHAPQRGRMFRVLAREDLRHLLKHKRTYYPDALTAREHAILASPSTGARLWMRAYKPVYLWVTRSILRWPERTGPAERVRKSATPPETKPTTERDR